MNSPKRKRILTQISQIRYPKSLISSHQNNSKLQRVEQVFKYSPPHSKQLILPELDFARNSPSKYKSEQSSLEQLNSIFKLRKIGEGKQFFRDQFSAKANSIRSKSKINRDIEHSIIYIDKVRTKQEKSIKKNYDTSSVKQRPNESFFKTLGLQLELPDFDNNSNINGKFITQSSSYIESKLTNNKKKEENQGGLYSYFERRVLNKKKLDLTMTKLINYSKRPNNRQFHKLMLQKSRKFLKDSIKNDYKSVGYIDTVLIQQSKNMIQKELEKKKDKYKDEYFSRNNVPYFSYLTLKKGEKYSVQKQIHRKKSLSHKLNIH